MPVRISRRAAMGGLGAVALAGGTTGVTRRARAQARVFDLPPKGFDPRSGGSAELQRYGLLARPGADASVEYKQLWSRVYAAKPNFVVPTFKARTRYRRMPVPRRQTFDNWAGQAVDTPGAPFVTVAGVWTVPNPRVPDDATNGERNYNSAWIGIDGYSAPSENDILQAGVDFNFMPGSTWVEIAAWWEWWPGGSFYVDNFPVAPGDTVSCVINGAVGGTDALVQLADLGTNTHMTFLATAPPGTRLAGNCAEWIVERQRHSTAEGSPLSDLSRFGSVFFDNAFASSAAPGAGGSVVKAGSGTPISMVADTGTQVLATPTVLGPTSFRVDRS
jgi:hypothetical protein